MDLVEEQRANKKRKRMLEASYEKQQNSDRGLLMSLECTNTHLKDEWAKRDAEARAHKGMCLRLGAHVARLNVEMADLQHEFDRERAILEKQKNRMEKELDAERQKSERLRSLKNEMARRRRAAELRAQTSGKRLERAQVAEESLTELQAQYDELHAEMEASAELSQSQQLSSEVFEPNEGAPSGRFGAYGWKLRLLIYKWLLRRTPPSAIGANIVDAAQFLAPGLQVRTPCLTMIRKMRQEATLIGEAISAFRIATAKRVVSFGFDETTKMGDGLASINLQIETAEGEICDEVLRAAFLIPGGCADQIARAMETKVFARSRKLLERWKLIYENKYGADSWPGPKPSHLGYHRLAGSLIMSDTCNAARAAKRMIIEMAGAEVEKLAREAGTWDSMGNTEKEMAARSYVGDCMQHIRNILIDAMASAAASLLKDELQESLDAFSAYERMSTDPMQLIRAAYKEFHHEGEYAKGKGKEFEHWRHTRHASAFFLPFERARGGRQDLAFDGAVPLFANRVLASTFLREQVYTPGHSNILEDFLWTTLSCVEMVALTRVLTLWDLLLSMPLRWLCGSSSRLTNWSIYDFGPVLDSVVTLLQNVAADGAVLFQTDLSPFAAVAAQQPLFKAWLDGIEEDELRAPDGKTTFKWYAMVLAEAREPTNKSNQEATDMIVQLAMVMATEGLKKMRDPKVAIHDWLSCTNGKFSYGLVSAEARMATIGAHATNDRVESNFGGYDAVIRQFRTISVDAAAGMAQQMRMHHFDPRSSHVVSDRRKAKTGDEVGSKRMSSSVGFFDNGMSEQLQQTCIEMGRQLRLEARNMERSDRREQAEYREMRRAQNLLLQVDALAERGALAIERFHAYESRAARSWQEALRTLESMSIAAQMGYLREQIELRSIGLGWTDLDVPWKQGKNESAAESVARVREHFRTMVLPAEADRRRNGLVPTEPPMPDFKAKSLKQLGMPTSDSSELAARALCSPEQLHSAIQREHERRAAAGFSDAVQAMQPKEAPSLDETLEGKQLEICWNYISTEDGKSKVPIWCPCTVIKIADGTTDRGRDGQLLSDRAKKLAPRGMVLVEWEPDPDRGEAEATQAWYLLDPNKWQGRSTERDKDSHRAWRYHPQQLVKERKRMQRDANESDPANSQ